MLSVTNMYQITGLRSSRRLNEQKLQSTVSALQTTTIIILNSNILNRELEITS